MYFRQALEKDLPQVCSLLKEHQLPDSDIAEHLENLVLVEQDNNIIGLGGLEICGDTTALLRSIVVEANHQNKGIATKIVQLLITKASDRKIKSLYLITESAVNYFGKFKFVVQDRSNTPDTIMQTKQFGELCPNTATLMLLKI